MGNEGVSGGILYLQAPIHAIEGDPDQALAALRQAVDAGWIHAWYIELDPNLVSLHDTPEFRQIIADMTGRIGEMRERLRLAEAGEEKELFSLAEEYTSPSIL